MQKGATQTCQTTPSNLQITGLPYALGSIAFVLPRVFRIANVAAAPMHFALSSFFFHLK